jgi:hypothetical protein
LIRQRAIIPILVVADIRRESLMMETMGSGSAATFGLLSVTGIDPAEPPIEDVTDEHETTRPTVRFLAVDDEVFVSSALGTLQFIG